MSDEEKAIVRAIFDWIDSFGPGRVDLQIDTAISDEDAAEIIEGIA